MSTSEQPSKILRLLKGDLTYSAAVRREINILHELTYWDQQQEFLTYLYDHRNSISCMVAQHFGLKPKECRVTEPADWLRGSFNLCIRVHIRQNNQSEKQVIIRFPLPYRVGEQVRPGNCDEKILCEAGTYAWLQENCPDLPIPFLHGFALGTGRTFTHIENLPWLSRFAQKFRRWALRSLGYPVPSRYVSFTQEPVLSLGYILIDYIQPSQGKMLSKTWKEGRCDAHLRMNLFRGLSRALVQLARVPLPRIGSFTLDEKGYLRLSNRPLSVQLHQMENEGLPIDIPRDITYESTSSYITDLFSVHESRLRYQPNAVGHLEDGAYQISALMVMRSVWSCFFRRDFLRGPFFLSLTDVHQSNIFVDDEWNITFFIDLEWAYSRPIEMIHPPFWLSSQGIDLVTVPEYEPLHAEFMQALAEEETTPPVLHPTLRQGLENGSFWFSLALDSPTALFKIFYDHIQPMFAKKPDESFWLVTMQYWGLNAFEFMEQRVVDKEKYDIALREAFTP